MVKSPISNRVERSKLMSVFRRTLPAWIAFMLLLQLFTISPVYANEAVVFGDPAVEQAVRTELSLPAGSITEDDMKSLRVLELPRNAEIKSLQGLEYAVNLYSLSAESNQIEDLAPLSHMTKLEILKLYGNRISALDPLASLSALKELNLHYNQIKDIRPLAGLAKLEKLYISQNQITDLTPFVAIASLNYADVTGNMIDVKAAMNQSALSSLKQRQVTMLGIEAQRKPPYEPQISWSKLFEEQWKYEPSGYAYGNGIYVSAEQYTSTDGVNWTSHEIDDKERRFYKVVFGKGLFLGIGLGSNHGVPAWTSKDGVNWSQVTVIRIGANFRDVVFTGNRFVVISDNSNDYNLYKGVFATSEDGLTWKVHPNALESNASMLAWGNGVLLALTDKSLYQSKDGIAWHKVSLPIKGTLRNIRYADNKFVIAADHALLASTDGTKWHVTSTPNNKWSQLVWVKGRFFVSSMNESGKLTTYMTSKDGKSWSPLKVSGKDLDIADIQFEDSKYIARSYSGHYSSADGVNWKQIKKINHMPTIVNGSAVGDGKLVSVGGYRNSWGFFQIDATGKASYGTEDGKGPLYDVIWTGKQFIAVGEQGLMMTSGDGIKWTETSAPTKESMYRIIRANDTYYVTGSNGLIMSSKDLKTWKKQKTNTTLHIHSIAWSGKTFVAVGSFMLQTVVLTSDNGTDWKPAKINRTTPDGSPALNLSDVAWGNGTFVITAEQNYHLDLPYTVFLSTDGKQWKKVGTKYETTKERDWSPSLNGVRFTGDQFAAVGNNGSVYLSKDGNSWGREEIPDSEQLFSVQAFNGKLYVVSAFTGQVYIGELKNP